MPSTSTAAGDITLGSLLDRAASEAGGKTALISGDVHLSFSELRRRVDSVAGGLARAGVRPGEPVGMLLHKCSELVITFLACARLGAVVVPLNFRLAPATLRAQVEFIGLKVVVVDAALTPLAEGLADVLDLGRSYFLGEPPPGGRPFHDLLNEAPLPTGVRTSPHDIIYLNYTSGSTGLPKGAMTSHANIQWNTLSSVEALGMTGDDVFLGMFTSFSHPHEFFSRSLHLMCTSVLVEGWNARAVARAIQAHKVTWMMAVPSFYEILTQHPPEEVDLSSLRCLEAGGAHMGAAALTRLEGALRAAVVPVWGSTEATGVAISLPPGPERALGAMGKPGPWYEARVVGEDGREVGPDQVGELLIRGPAVVNGYYKMPGESARAFAGGWYHTGDLVRRSADGTLWFVSRRSEMLKVGGLRVYPLEIEAALAAHPAVAEVVVVRGEDRLRGEVARAIVTLVPEASAQPAELRAFCRERLASYQLPRYVEIWESLPHLPNGKIDKRAVADARPAEG